MHVGEGNEPFLPNRHLENGSSVFFAFVEQNGQVGEEKTFDVKNARRLFGIPKRGR